MNNLSSPAPVADPLADAMALTAIDRQAVDRLIADRLRSEIALVNQISTYIIAGGGKRLRPLIHLLCARAAGYTGTHHIQLAAVIEFIHTATLLHDDVVDESSQRRGREAAHRIWGNAASVLVGDFLYSRSFQLMVELECMETMQILANTTNTIAEGEVLQLMQMGNADLDVRDYFQVISDKTASLFGASARLGGVLAGRDKACCQGLEQFGLLLGQAFQITDDVLDYQADDTKLGKSLGDDLAEGKVTLPLILTMKRAGPAQRERLRDLIHEGGTGQFTEVLELMQRSGALDEAMEHAWRLSNESREHLAVLPECRERDALDQLALYAVERSL